MGIQFKIFLLLLQMLVNSAPAQPVGQLSSPTERQALLELRSSLGISAKDWHKKANPCLNWTGVECKNCHVTRINLLGLRRTRAGKLNPQFAIDSLQNLPLLSSFNSSGFLLRGQIPEWFGQRMSNLEVLDLRSSSIYGYIPDSLSRLNRLNALFLSNNSITGDMPASLGKLVSLSVLDLSQNVLTGQIPDEISALGNLKILDLSSNLLSGGIPLGLGSLHSLKLLNLSYNTLSLSIPGQLGNLSRLVELDLGFNYLFGSLPAELGGLISLRKMCIGNNLFEDSLPDSLFPKLHQLEYLALGRNKFVGMLPRTMLSMTGLKYLDVSRNNLTGLLPNFVLSYNVTGAVFNFSHNLFYGNISCWMGKFGISIDVSDNYLEGLAPNNTGIIRDASDNCFSGVGRQRNLKDCSMFYAERGLFFGTVGGEETQEPQLKQAQKSRRRFTYIMAGALGGSGFIIVIIAATLLLLKACKVGSKNQQKENQHMSISNYPDRKVFVDFSKLGESFTYDQIFQATDSFSTENLIKKGHCGDIFQGKLEDGSKVVVKRVDFHSVGEESFLLESELLGDVLHPRLVPLLGHCLEKEHEKLLVYKYMPNGDLSNAMYRVRNSGQDLQSLDWITRLKVAIGAAEALSYLHHECNPPIVHRDIQASSILLDDKYEVRLGSFGEVCVAGGNGHQNVVSKLIRAPQTSGKRSSGSSSVTFAYDVYCFGKVLLELVTGKLGISRLNEEETKQWLDSNLPFINIHDKELINKIVDQSLIIDEDLLEEVWAVAVVAKSCLNPRASQRPSMRLVLQALENPFKVVRQENFGSMRLRTASSRQSWTAAFFGSLRHSSSESSNASTQTNREKIIGGLRQSERVGSRGSGVNDYSLSHKRSSSEVFPEPVEIQDL